MATLQARMPLFAFMLRGCEEPKRFGLWLVAVSILCLLTACSAPVRNQPSAVAGIPSIAPPSPATVQAIAQAVGSIDDVEPPCTDTGNAADLLEQARAAASAGDEARAQQLAQTASNASLKAVNDCYLSRSRDLVADIHGHPLLDAQRNSLNQANKYIDAQNGRAAYDLLKGLWSSVFAQEALQAQNLEPIANSLSGLNPSTNPAQGCTGCCENDSTLFILVYPRDFYTGYSIRKAHLFIDGDATRLGDASQDTYAVAGTISGMDKTFQPVFQLGPLTLTPDAGTTVFARRAHSHEEDFSWTVTSPSITSQVEKEYPVLAYLPVWKHYKPDFRVFNKAAGCNPTAADTRDIFGKDTDNALSTILVWNYLILLGLIVCMGFGVLIHWKLKR